MHFKIRSTRILVTLLFLAFLSGLQASAQITSTASMLEPNVAKLIGSYNIAMNYYSGVPEIKLPLVTVNGVGLQVPIELMYDPSGVKVEDRPSWVGLGWSLNHGGVITRKVNGRRDEWNTWGYMFAQRNPTGTSSQAYIAENAFNSIPTTFTSNPVLDKVVTSLLAGSDSGPDEFQFIINGQTGRFFIDRNGNIVADGKYTIAYFLEQNMANTPPGSIGPWYFKKFIITDENGTKYIFTDRDAQESWSWFYGDELGQDDGNADHTTWYLTALKSMQGLDSIKFEYQANPQRYDEYVSNDEYTVNTYTAGGGSKVFTSVVSRVTQYQSLLTRIYTENEEVTFATIKPSGQLRVYLDSMVFKDKISGSKWYYKFNYQVYPSTENNRKFLLSSIDKVSDDERINYYSFQYNQTPLAFYTGNSTEQSEAGIDYWGYYSGIRPSYYTRIPRSGTMYRSPNTITGLPDRTPNSLYNKTGSLEQIILPTKGKIKFTFETNDYSYINNITTLTTKKLGGGLRIKTIVYHDDQDEYYDIKKEYSYNSLENPALSSGVINYEPACSFVYQFPGYSTEYFLNESMVKSSIGYAHVRETDGDGSWVDYNFHTARDYPPTPYSDDAGFICNDYVQGGQKHQILPSSVLFAKKDEQNTHMRGLLKSKLLVNSSGKRLREEKYTYHNFNIGRLVAYDFINYYFRTVTTPVSFTPPVIVRLVSKYYIGVGRAEIATDTVNEYDHTASESIVLQTARQFSYNSYHRLRETSTVGSDGKARREINTYPTDYYATAMNGSIEILKSKNAYGLPIEKIEIVNDKVIRGAVREYNNIGQVSCDYQLEIKIPVTYTSEYFNPNNHISRSEYKPRYNYFYLLDRLTGVKSYDFNTSYIWGYNRNKVIASVENAERSQVFYNGFEDTGTSDPDAKVGRRSYTGDFTFAPPAGFAPASNSVLSYWYWEDSKWNFIRKNYSAGSVLLSEGSKIDEVRIHPEYAVMRTYGHDVNSGVTEIMDANSLKTSFEYDLFGRFQLKRDDRNNILSIIKYHYKN